MAVPQQLEELLDGGDGGVRVRPHRHDLPQEHAERPHVRLRRVPPLEERLRGHPLDGQPATRRVNFDESVFRMLLKTVLKTGFLVKISYFPHKDRFTSFVCLIFFPNPVLPGFFGL